MVGLGVPPTFVGRRREMSLLVDALEAAARGRGSAVLLCGEPGMGKSRTAEELIAEAEHDRAKIVWGVRGRRTRCFVLAMDRGSRVAG
jgi:hypothetical protein